MRRWRARSVLDSKAAETTNTENEVPQLFDISSTCTWIGFKWASFCSTHLTDSAVNGMLRGQATALIRSEAPLTMTTSRFRLAQVFVDIMHWYWTYVHVSTWYLSICTGEHADKIT